MNPATDAKSTEIQFLLDNNEATPVIPLPQKPSNIISPGLV